MPPETLTTRQLNRALLARQMLLERIELPPLEAVDRLSGLQAQIPRPPFLALWSRLENFRRDDLHRLITAQQVVRVTWLRATIHLLSKADFLRFRRTIQPALSRALNSALGRHLGGLEFERVVAGAREALGDDSLPFDKIRPLLAERFPNVNDRVLGYLVRTHLPLVMVPNQDKWGWPAKAGFAVAERWLGDELDSNERKTELVKRYLAAFGPATPADMQNWSGLTALKPVFETLRQELAVLRDPKKREVFDLPDAPRPPEDTPAPVRFLADFDNAILGHNDRSRIIPDEFRARLVTKNLTVTATFLVDGFVAGIWRILRAKKTATLSLTPFVRLNKKVRGQLEREGEKLLAFAEPETPERMIEFIEG